MKNKEEEESKEDEEKKAKEKEEEEEDRTYKKVPEDIPNNLKFILRFYFLFKIKIQ